MDNWYLPTPSLCTKKEIEAARRWVEGGGSLFLVTTSFDELPQLWNVLRGEMSLVGPRPYLPRESGEIGATYTEIKRVSPGMTGPGRSAAGTTPPSPSGFEWTLATCVIGPYGWTSCCWHAPWRPSHLGATRTDSCLHKRRPRYEAYNVKPYPKDLRLPHGGLDSPASLASMLSGEKRHPSRSRGLEAL